MVEGEFCGVGGLRGVRLCTKCILALTYFHAKKCLFLCSTLTLNYENQLVMKYMSRIVRMPLSR